MYRINWIVILSLVLFFGGCRTDQTEGAEDTDTDSVGEQTTDSTTDEHPGTDEDTGSETDEDTGSETDTETETEPCDGDYADGGTCPDLVPWEEPCEQECQLCEYGYWGDGCGGVGLLCLENQWRELYHTDPSLECDDAGSGDAGSGDAGTGE